MRAPFLFLWAAACADVELDPETEALDVAIVEAEAAFADLPEAAVPPPPNFGLAWGSDGFSTVGPLPPGTRVQWMRSRVGTGNGPCPPALNGTCVDIRRPSTVASAVVRADGYASRRITVPAGQAWLQAFALDPAGPATASGVTTPAPGFCTMIFDPVCGSDGTTWSNACVAGAGGHLVAYDGPC